jgi:hypothetical protein
MILKRKIVLSFLLIALGLRDEPSFKKENGIVRVIYSIRSLGCSNICGLYCFQGSIRVAYTEVMFPGANP